MRKLMMLAAMLALVAALAAPAIAQVSQGLAERSTTGNFNATFTANSTGDNANQCVTPLQFGNTAPQQNVQGVLQYGSNTGGGFSPFNDGLFNDGSSGGGSTDLTGPTFTFAPVLNAPCEPKVEQSSAASSS